MKLSEREQRLCAAADLSEADSLASLAQRSGQRISTTRYLLQKLLKAGVIYRRVRIDFLKLGLVDTAVFLSMGDLSRQARARFERQVMKDKRVCYLGSLAGQYQYGLVTMTDTISEVGTFLHDLADMAGKNLVNRVIAPRLSFTQYSRGYLAPGLSRRTLVVGHSDTAVEVDELDKRILSTAAGSQFDSMRALARTLGEPHATIERRFSKLVDNKVIQGVFFEIDPRQIPVSAFRVHVGLRFLGGELAASIQKFCARSPNVTFLTHAFGSWDYEIGLEVTAMSEVTQFTSELSELVSEAMSSLDILAEVADLKWTFYPG
jgi:DNA-binding Lrp family transcriptional regulator